MAEVASPPPAVSPLDLRVGQEVDVESRTWAGINKPGGHARISKVHYGEGGAASRVDVKYVLGGREANLELTYVRAHVELERGGRSRRRDKKMNVETLGGVEGEKAKEKKKRKALSSIDKNHGEAKETKREVAESLPQDTGSAAVEDVGPKKSKKTSKPAGEKKRKANANKVFDSVEAAPTRPNQPAVEAQAGLYGMYAADAGEAVTDRPEDWEFIKDGKAADYAGALTKGRRVKYWWSVEDGWLKGTVTKPLNKVVTKTTIGWFVNVRFDNGDNHRLDFDPKERRWKVLPEDWNAAAGQARASSVKPSATAKVAFRLTKGQAQPGKATTHVKEKKANTASAARAPAPSFGPQLQSKIKELSSKMHRATSSGEVDVDGLASMTGKAAHAKPSSKSSHDTKKKAAKARPEQASLISPSSPTQGSHGVERTEGTAATGSWKDAEAVRSQASMDYAESMKAPGAHTVSHDLHKGECEKAEKFVNYMTEPSKANKRTSSSPGSGDGDLELKLDHERIGLFNEALSEIMFRRNIDAMDVEEMIAKTNASLPPSQRHFTPLEVKGYLRKLDEEGRIFMDHEEGNLGTAYSM